MLMNTFGVNYTDYMPGLQVQQLKLTNALANECPNPHRQKCRGKPSLKSEAYYNSTERMDAHRV